MSQRINGSAKQDKLQERRQAASGESAVKMNMMFISKQLFDVLAVRASQYQLVSLTNLKKDPEEPRRTQIDLEGPKRTQQGTYKDP